MRAAEYLVPRASGDTDDGECIVITFGPGQGGGIDENINRWVTQFAGATGTKRTSRQVGGMKVSRVETVGTYTAMRMPGASADPASHANWRLLGAIVEAPSGLWFFKVTGPDATVKAAASQFDSMIDSAHPGEG
jgi:hypothetical protein